MESIYLSKNCRKIYSKKKITTKKIDNDIQFINFKNNIKKNKYFKKIFSTPKNLIIKFLNFFNRKNYQYLIFGNNFGLINEFIISFKFNQLPFLGIDYNETVNRKIDCNLRKKIKESFNFKNKF